jgi:murein DD-endopeptidase MepM/ murein hydrolase activator NlpD
MNRFIRTGLIALAGLALSGFAPTNANAQEQPTGIEQLVLDTTEEMHVVRHTFSENERLRNLNFQTENYDTFQWLLDTYNTPLSQGDELTVLEVLTEQGHYIPLVLDLDYADPEKQDILLFGEPSSVSLPYASVWDYHDMNGDRRRRLWTNNTNPSLFDIVIRDIVFPLEGDLYDHYVTSHMGLRNNPLPEAGGPDINDHKGTDWRAEVGTPIIASFDGYFNAGYGRRNLELHPEYESDLLAGKYGVLSGGRIIRNTNRRPEWEQLSFLYFHLSDVEREIRDTIIEQRLDAGELTGDKREEFRRWYEMLLSGDEEDILRSFRWHGIHDRIMVGTPVQQGQLLAYTGNTGLSEGPHLHVGITRNGEIVDPFQFFRDNARVHVYEPRHMQDLKEEYELFLYNWYEQQ